MRTPLGRYCVSDGWHTLYFQFRFQFFYSTWQTEICLLHMKLATLPSSIYGKVCATRREGKSKGSWPNTANMLRVLPECIVAQNKERLVPQKGAYVAKLVPLRTYIYNFFSFLGLNMQRKNRENHTLHEEIFWGKNVYPHGSLHGTTDFDQIYLGSINKVLLYAYLHNRSFGTPIFLSWTVLW